MKNLTGTHQQNNSSIDFRILEALREQTSVCAKTVNKLEKLNGHSYELLLGITSEKLKK